MEVQKFRDYMFYIFGIAFPFWLSIISFGLLEKSLIFEFWIFFYIATIPFIVSMVLLILAKPICKWIWRHNHKTRLKHSIIGIIREYDETQSDGRLIPAKSRYFPEDWEHLINSFQDGLYKTRYIDALKVEDNWNDLIAIINPYGEGYPEKDIGKKETFEKIMKYVEDGGVFVNVCGAPFWYAWNPTVNYTSTAGEVYGLGGKGFPTGKIIQVKPKRKQIYIPEYDILLKDPTYNLQPVQSLVDTLVNDRLGLLTTTQPPELRPVFQNKEDVKKGFSNILQGIDFPLVIEFRATRRPTQNFIPMIRAKLPVNEKDTTEIYPIAYVPWGFGKFLFCGFLMASEENKNYPVEQKYPKKTTYEIMDGHIELILRSLHILIEQAKNEYLNGKKHEPKEENGANLNCKM